MDFLCQEMNREFNTIGSKANDATFAQSVVIAKTELEKTREQGYATDNEEFVEGLVAVAVPIRSPDGRFCAGLALHAPKFRMTMETAIDQLPALRPTPDFSSSKTCLEEFMQHVSDHKSWPLRPPPQNMMRCEHNN